MFKRCVVFKFDAMRKRFMNRASFGDLRKALALRLVEIAFDTHIAGDFFNKSPVRDVAIFAIVDVDARKIVGGGDGFQR